MTPPIGSARSGIVGSTIGTEVPDSEDLHARYDATELSLSGGDSVSTWTDETGNGYDLTAGAAPTYKTSTLNGNPVVRFDGVDDFLNTTFSALSQPNHIFIVMDINSFSTSSNDIFFDGNGGGRHIFFIPGADNFRMFAGSALDGSSPDTSTHIYSTLWDGASSHLRRDGTELLSGHVGSKDLSGLTVGADNGGEGNAEIDVGEMLIYPEDKSSIEADVESYLSDKWGIAV